jgi:hypothetical protein
MSKVNPDEQIRAASPDYFRVIQTPLMAGRFFTVADTADSPPVAIVNQALAKKFWPNESPLGKALLGKHIGDEVEVEAPKGKIKFKIVGIE